MKRTEHVSSSQNAEHWKSAKFTLITRRRWTICKIIPYIESMKELKLQGKQVPPKAGWDHVLTEIRPQDEETQDSKAKLDKMPNELAKAE